MIGATRIVHHFDALWVEMKCKGTDSYFISDSINHGGDRLNGCWSQESPVRATIPAAVCTDHKRRKKVLVVREERPKEIFEPLKTSRAKGPSLQSDCRPNPALVRLKCSETSHHRWCRIPKFSAHHIKMPIFRSKKFVPSSAANVIGVRYRLYPLPTRLVYPVNPRSR